MSSSSSSSRADKKKNCESCGARFGLTTHKHSCKRCHAIICSECSKQKLQIAEYVDKKAHKICLNCNDDNLHNTNLIVTGKIQWGVDSNIMKQWLKNINTVNLEKLQSQYEEALTRTTPLTSSPAFQEYITNIDIQITQGNTTRHFTQSFFEMLHRVWGGEIDILKVKASVINVLKGFFAEFPDQESQLSFKQEYVDVTVFLMLFGSESSVWRLLKEIYGIIIPIESVAHISNNDFNYGEKYLMSFLLDKIRFGSNSPEATALYCFIQDKGIEFINSFFINRTNFQTAYQVFNLVINMPYNRRWSELLRSLGIFILENQDILGNHYGRSVWSDLCVDLLVCTKWRQLKDKMDVFCLFQIADTREMSRFSMIEDFTQQDVDSQMALQTEDVLEENKMLKREVFQIFKVKQLILEKTQQLEDMRQKLQKRDLSHSQLEEAQQKLAETNKNLQSVTQQLNDVKQANIALQEKLDISSSGAIDFKRVASFMAGYTPPQKQSQQLTPNKCPTAGENFPSRSESMPVNSFILQSSNPARIFSQSTEVKTSSPGKLSENEEKNQIVISPRKDQEIKGKQDGNNNIIIEEENKGINKPSSGEEQQLILSLQSQLQAMQLQRDESLKEIKQLNVKVEALNGQFKSQGDQILKHRMDKMKLEEENDSLKQELKRVQEELDKAKIQHSNDISKQAENQLFEIKTNKDQHEKIIQELKVSYEKQLGELRDSSKSQEIMDGLKQQINTLNEKVQQLSMYNQILQQEKAEIVLQKNSLVHQLNTQLKQQCVDTNITSSNSNSNQKLTQADTLRNTILQLEFELQSQTQEKQELSLNSNLNTNTAISLVSQEQQVQKIDQEEKSSESELQNKNNEAEQMISAKNPSDNVTDQTTLNLNPQPL